MSGKVPKKKDRPGVDRYGRTPLNDAALEGRWEQVEQLLRAGADPNTADDNGETPLHFATRRSDAELVRLLLEAGARVDPQDVRGNTPLSNAVFESRGNGAVINLLRAHGADPYKANRHGVSPLSLARIIANYDVKQFFADLP